MTPRRDCALAAEQKRQRFGARCPQTKTPTQSGAAASLAFAEKGRAEAKGGEWKCHLFVMKYRSIPGVGPWPRPKTHINVKTHM